MAFFSGRERDSPEGSAASIKALKPSAQRNRILLKWLWLESQFFVKRRDLMSPKKILILLALWSALLAVLTPVPPQANHFIQAMDRGDLARCAEAKEAVPVPAPLPGSGEKCWIGNDYYFVYSFNKKPQMGTVILKIQLFDKNAKRITSPSITGDCGMPSMRAHDTGSQPFQLNKKGDYLLPLNIVMPGEWEVKLTFLKDKVAIYYGSLKFEV
jgi:hypothetical protein